MWSTMRASAAPPSVPPSDGTDAEASEAGTPGTASTPEDVGPFFDPANDKPYRHPQYYKVPRGVRV